MKRFFARLITQVVMSVAIGLPLTLFWDYFNDFFRGMAFAVLVSLGTYIESILDYILGEETKQDNQN